VLGAARGWWSPIPAQADLVLAGRVLAQWQSRGTPFFTMGIMPFTEDPRFGMGGHRTMRGFRQDRFVGYLETLANAELRWTFARTVIRQQRFAFIAAPFFDYGRAFDAAGDVSLRGWRPSYGGALRVSWNLSTLATFDYGISREGSGFYANFGHTF
jgi:hemolysin activation/secretion protein